MDSPSLPHKPSISMAKHTSSSDHSTSTATSTPTTTSPEPHNDHFHNNMLLKSFLLLSDSTSIDASLNRLLESTSSDSEKNDFIHRAILLASLLLEAGKRSDRKSSSFHNSVVWPLPPDLTIKVFAMVDTQSVCCAAATCSFFRKCAADPLCFADIDLVRVVSKVNNDVVSSVIWRAGNALQSIKLGVLPPCTSPISGLSEPLVSSIRNSADASGFSTRFSFLTRSCLSSLSENGGALGDRLRSLHLFNIKRMDNAALLALLSVCRSLLDLEIVGLYVDLTETLESVSKHCPLIERLVFEATKRWGNVVLRDPICNEFVRNFPNLTTLALKGCKLQDYQVQMLVKGLCKLKHVDFSTSYSFTGAFLKNLGSTGLNHLEVMILRDCMHLKDIEVEHFMGAILAGEFKHLRHLDISNRKGLASDDYRFNRCYSASFISIKQLLEERPNFTLVAEFPPEGSYIDADRATASDSESDASSESQLSSLASDDDEEDDDDDDDDYDDDDDDDYDEHEDRAARERSIREYEENRRWMEQQARQTTEMMEQQARQLMRMEDYKIAHMYARELEANRRFSYEEQVRHYHDYHAGLPYVETPPHVDYSTLGLYTPDKPRQHYPQSHRPDWVIPTTLTPPAEGSSSQSQPGLDDARSVYMRVMESIFGPPSGSC